MERLLTLWIFLAMAAGVALGYAWLGGGLLRYGRHRPALTLASSNLIYGNVLKMDA